MARKSRQDLSVFTEANEQKIPWDERVQLIAKVFPSTVDLDWDKMWVADPRMLGDLVTDIIKVTQEGPKRPGKRPPVDKETAIEKLRVFQGDDYTDLPFSEAFGQLAGSRSIRSLAAKTGLDRNAVFRLLRGKLEPDAFMMEQVAKAFKKDPSFFSEYRDAWVATVVLSYLKRSPEASVHLYRRLRGIGRRTL